MLPYHQNESWYIDYQDEPHDMFILQDFYTRPNANFRSLVDLHLREMERMFHLQLDDYGHNASCVAAHIRRGDRIPNDGNVTKYCAEHPNDFEKACGSKVEFGLLKLDHITKHAERVVAPHVRTLFVATDDLAYLKSEMHRLEAANSPWKIAYVPWLGPEDVDLTPGLSEKEQQERYHKMRHNGGAISGAQYFASMKVLRKCEAFVGHFASAVSHMIYHQMCERHAQYVGMCPPRYNLAEGYR